MARAADCTGQRAICPQWNGASEDTRKAVEGGHAGRPHGSRVTARGLQEGLHEKGQGSHAADCLKSLRAKFRLQFQQGQRHWVIVQILINWLQSVQ